jgi:hypothetical protein
MIVAATDNTRSKLELFTSEKGYRCFQFKAMTLYRIGADAEVQEVRTLTEYTVPVTYSRASTVYDDGDSYYRQGHRDRKEKALLDASGLKEKQRVLCKFTMFEPYSTAQTMGKLFGTTLDGVGVVMFGAYQSDASEISKVGYFEAVVSGVGLWQNDNADLTKKETITVSIQQAKACVDTMVSAVLVENGKVIEEDIFFIAAIPDNWIISDTLKVGDLYPPKSNVLALVV